MSLKSRLDTLRREAGAASPVAGGAEAEAAGETGRTPLAERLARLNRGGGGRRVRPAEGGRAERPDTATLAHTLGASVIAEHLLCIERPVAPDELGALARLGGGESLLPGARVPPPERLLFVDTETSGLAGGAGTLAFMVGLLRLHDRGAVVRQYLLTGFSGEPAMYEALRRETADVAAVVSYNGKSFDAPLLRDRACLLRQPSPLAAPAHLDLLHAVRRLYGSRWPDCRLATAEARLLGFEREGDMPGAEAPMAWFEFVHHGEYRRLPGVLAHNHRDLVSLACLLPAVVAGHRQPDASADSAAVARAWLRHGDERRARAILDGARATLSPSHTLTLARLHRRAGALSEAVRLWRALAERGEPGAMEALAKYYEHVAGDCGAALACAERLAGTEAEARRRRLAAKLEAAARQTELALER